MLEFIRPYTPDFVGWLRDFGQGAANYDANGHYARIPPIANAFSFADNPAGGAAHADPARRSASTALETGVHRALPGRRDASAPADGSAPYTDDGNCCPTTAIRACVLPGP